VAAAAAEKIAAGAKAALAELDKLPADPAAAKAALAAIEAKIKAALPDGATATPDDAAKPAASDDGAATKDAQTEEKKADTGKSADEAKPVETKLAVPAFDILRVEKDGSTVIAGRAAPGARIEIVDGDKVIASADADASGDFVAVLDNPLAAGDHSIVLKSTTKDGKPSTSEEVATVSVPKDGTGELLAMVTKPGEASRILAMPEAKDTEVASKGVTPDEAKETTKADAGKTATEDTAKVEPTDIAKADAAKVEDAAKTADTAADVAVAMPDLPDSSVDIASTPPVVGEDKAKASTTENDGQQIAKVDPEADKTAADDSQAAKTPEGAPEVVVSAVELEGDKIFVAGSARPGAVVRIYADDQVVAEAKTDDTGRFVADGTIKLAVGNHTIRADVLSADGAKVEFRASVPFFRPEGDIAAVASSDPAKTAKDGVEPLADGAFDKARVEVGKAMGLLQGLYAGGRIPTAEELAAARSSAEIALKSLADTHVAADVDPAVAEMAKKAVDDAAKALDKLKAVPKDVAAFKAALDDVEATVTVALKPMIEVASAEVDKVEANKVAEDAAADKAKPATDETAQSDAVEKTDEPGADDVKVTAKVDRLAKSTDAAADDTADKPADETAAKVDDQAADKPVDDTASDDTASSDGPKVIEQAPLKESEDSVIIRRGDTLWQISRRVYGKGVRYTTIYVANKGQIEDADRIKPGQVFSMPGKWLENAEELHKERLTHEHQKQ
jgi:nucleoid-associated protein YgaU